MNVLALIPARKGSKGFPDKNIAELRGVSLLELAVKVALDCDAIDDVFISTDSSHYEKIAKAAGASSLGLRSAILAEDHTKTIDVVLDFFSRSEVVYDYVVLLQPTSPVRTPMDIAEMLKLVDDVNADACVSLVPVDEPHPYKLKVIENGKVEPMIKGASSEVPRQLLPSYFALNGAIYISKVSSLLKNKTFLPENTLPYLMNENFNIDSEEDYIYLKAMLDAEKVCLWGVV